MRKTKYPFVENHRCDKFKILKLALFSLAGMLLIAALVAGIGIYSEGEEAETNAHKLLKEYEHSIGLQPKEQQPADQAQEPVETTTPVKVVDTFDGYQIIGKLQIEKINIVLPVIAYTDDEVLKVSVCYYDGPLPGTKGNLIITGHNYASGAHFGRLDELDIGDIISLSTPDERMYHYQIYETTVIKPDEVDAISEYIGDYALTLMTCTNRGNRRLIVRCELIETH